MKVIAINGSPRKNWNTHILLSKALEGAQAVGAQTELINLYDLDYKGCYSCFACKEKNGDSMGRCPINDDIKPILDAIHSCDGFILGSPIYLGDVTAMMRALWERLIFQYLNYDDYSKPFINRKIKTAAIFTMNVPEAWLEHTGYDKIIKAYESTLQSYFGHSTHMVSGNTLQVNDYSRYHMATFNEADKKKHREVVFPEECKRAYELGKSIMQLPFQE
jgi:multimeric flavodoxin WrbA